MKDWPNKLPQTRQLAPFDSAPVSCCCPCAQALDIDLLVALQVLLDVRRSKIETFHLVRLVVPLRQKQFRVGDNLPGIP